MYFIEKIIRVYLKFFKKENSICIPDENIEFELEDILTCNHVFMPLDSAKQLFACIKCGYIISKSRLKNKKTIKK